MSSSSYRHALHADSAARRRRAIVLALVLALHIAAVIFLLLQASAPPIRLENKAMPVTFQMLPEPQAAKPGAKPKPNSAPATPKPPATAPKPIKPPPELPFLTLSKADLAAADIAKLPSTPGARDAGNDGTGKDSRLAYGPGEGPGGEQLFDAEWYRKPTDAELSFYIPAGAPRTGWGLVACQTVEHYHVENCRQLGESPLGSGLGRAVRLAAWQFLVLPPRIGGRPVIGSWVRIRIDYTQRVAKEP